MATLPQFQSDDKDFQLMQNKWASILNPLITNQLTQGFILKNVELQSGANTINHRLGKALTGWVLVRQRGPAAIYDTQDDNQLKALTLQLQSSANVSVDLYVF